jgi:hypothetical protein
MMDSAKAQSSWAANHAASADIRQKATELAAATDHEVAQLKDQQLLQHATLAEQIAQQQQQQAYCR